MKKLMIAAAAAAMICGVEAVPLAYDFSATLKTTTGKAAGKSSSSYTVNLGMDDSGTFWYEDKNIDAYQDAKNSRIWWGNVGVISNAVKYTTKNNKLIGSLNTSVVKTDDVKAYVADFFSDNWDFVAEGKTRYNKKSAGKWCQTFKFKLDDEACYRTSGSKKIKGRYVADECCDLAFIAEDEDAAELGDLNFVFINRFGGITAEKATKVEAFASLGDDIADGTSANQFSLAGQGTWNDKLIKIDDEYVAGVSAISGSIVGELDAPTCEYCCQRPEDARVFECDGTFDPTYSLLTAAYGTWDLKFNSKATKELNQ